MANGLESTLASIRGGGVTTPGVSLADQIAATQAKRRQQRQAMQMSLMEQMRKQRKAELDARKTALNMDKTRQEMSAAQREQLNNQLFSTSRGLLTLAQQNPQAAAQRLANKPKLAQALQVDPSSPNFVQQLQAAHDRYRAAAQGDIPDRRGDQWRPVTEEERQAYNIPVGEVAQINEETGKVETEGGQTINVGGQQGKYEETVGAGIGEMQIETLKKGISASKTIQDMETMETSLLASGEGGFKTGFLGEMRQLASQAFEYFNVDPGTVNLGAASTSEVIDSISGELAVQLAENLDRATNLQFRTVKRAVPNLGKTVQGNLILSNLIKRDAKNQQMKGRLASAFMNNSENGTTLSNDVTIDGISLSAGTTYQEALQKVEESFEPMDEATQNYIAKSAQYENALVAPTTDDGRTINVNAMQEGRTYLMPDSRVIKYLGNGEVEVIEELNAKSE